MNGTFYFGDIDQRIARRAEGLTRRDLAVSTNIASLDRVLGGGLGPGELGIIMGPPKCGKTTFSVNLAYGAMVNGLKVLHVTLGEYEETIIIMYDARISGISKDDVTRSENKDALKQAVNTFYGSPGIERTNIKHFNAQACSPMAIEQWIINLNRLHNFDPDLIVVDYLGLMVSDYQHIPRDSERWIVLGDIARSLISLAQRGPYAIWLLHQSNRSSKNKKTVDLEDSADSYDPVRDADVVLTLNQVEEEQNYDSGSITKMRIFVAGARSVADRVGVDVAIDKKFCRIEELLSR
jgi:replicative DNA helicase